MSAAPLLILLLVLLVIVTFLLDRTVVNSQSNRARRDAADADATLSQAESKLLLNQDAEAEALFTRALAKAETSGNILLAAEAYHGFSRLALRRGNLKEAERMLEFALKDAPVWRDYKPHYALLLERELARVRSEL